MGTTTIEECKKRTAEAIAVMAASTLTLQTRFRGEGDNGWTDTSPAKVVWNWSLYDYRWVPKTDQMLGIIEVMQAYLDGNAIEVMSAGWERCLIPQWNWGGDSYRVSGVYTPQQGSKSMEPRDVTKLHTTKALEVMQAFLDGQPIQCRRCGKTRSWDTVKNPTWNWDGFEYRVAPLPDKTFEESVRAHIQEQLKSGSNMCGCSRKHLTNLYRKLFNEEP